MFMPSLAAEPVLSESAPIVTGGQIPELSAEELAAYQYAAGVIDRSLARLRYDARKRVWAHLARVCASMAE